MEKKIVVPEGMLRSATAEGARWSDRNNSVIHELEAALRWLSENPIVPTPQQWKDIEESVPMFHIWDRVGEWQRRMFLSPEPEVPEEIKDLVEGMSWNSTTPKAIIEAFRRGQKSR